ncbi:FKBP-type peptidyl-prolyl cis-trans isomerase [Candidatus Pacearchaeota archaeon]|nr:FKBP-type peptidyl-prolyl cis-trans isomerase [Candidatus Pacearchaeota archaeon]
MTLKQKDFIEIEFTGKTEDGEVFDSNVKEDLDELHKEHNHDHEHSHESKPFVFCLGEGMFLKGVEDFIIGKLIPSKPTEYLIELPPEKAFGIRNNQLIKIIPMKLFRENNINPIKGATFNFDGRIAKIISISGGRIIVDFNNPVAGKKVFYKIKILRKVDDLNEKTKAMINFLFRRDLKFEIKDKKLILEIEKPFRQFTELFSEKLKDVLGLELEIKEIEQNKEK